MTVRFRPYDPDRRFVWPLLAPPSTTRRRWLALHRTPPDWSVLFGRALDLMMIDARPDGACGVIIGGGTSRLRWRQGRTWTIIDLELEGMGGAKRAVVRTALLKAARYAS